jgi:ADP-ribosylglycohydrolase
MFGAIAGDIIGSVFEHDSIKTTAFPLFSEASRFTDDTVLSVAVADAILNQIDYATALKQYARKYPNAGYGISFLCWMI